MKPIVSIPLKYGLIGSLLAVVLLLVLFYTGTHPLLIPTFFDYRIVLFALFIFFGIKEFKDFYNNRFLQFWQGMVIGIGIYVVIGLVVGLFLVAFASVETNFYDEYIAGTISGLELNKEQLLNQGKVTITEEQYNDQLEKLKNTPVSYLGIDYFIKSGVLGFFLTIILSVVLRRSEKRFTK